ncbi:MAG TPA: DUF559 domain-containing protein, partial [Candidatus Baltobacteraceae bacterium]|nr:DUF559 domain-containing protein [Candidatus Baltobacteraceae bacterium]
MPKENIKDGLNISRQQMAALLNEDLAREYQAVIAYTVYSQVLKGAEFMDIAKELELHAGEELAHAIKIAKQVDYFGGMPVATPKPVKLSTDAKTMLRADLENERETIAHYRQRIQQAEALGEFALSETFGKSSCRNRSMRLICATRWALMCLFPKNFKRIQQRFIIYSPRPALCAGRGTGRGTGRGACHFLIIFYDFPVKAVINARQLRRNQTDEEKELWQALKAGRFAGFKFRRQHLLDKYCLDFYCPTAKLSIELDGFHHGLPEQHQHDVEREKFLVAKGIEELRFWNHQWQRNRDGVLLEIWNVLHRRTGCVAV